MIAARLARFVLVAGLLLLAGCAATQTHTNDLLTLTLYDYSGAIRWNRPDAAAKWLDPEIEAIRVKPIELERYAQVQFTGYDVKATERIDDQHYAQEVAIRLINNHTQAERTVVDRQVWRFDPEIRQWWLTTGLPKITQR